MEGRALIVCKQGTDGRACQHLVNKPWQQSKLWKYMAWPRQSSFRDLALDHYTTLPLLLSVTLGTALSGRRRSPSGLLSEPLRGRW